MNADQARDERGTRVPMPLPPHLRADPRKSRLSVVETVYYHQLGAPQPIAYDHRFGCSVDSTEQAYVRLTFVGEDWKPLDTGWVKEATLVVIKNEAGIFKRNPTTDEWRVEQEKVLEISLVPHSSPPCSCLRIGPQQSQRFTPTELSRLKIRCRKGDARYTVVIIPG